MLQILSNSSTIFKGVPHSVTLPAALFWWLLRIRTVVPGQHANRSRPAPLVTPETHYMDPKSSMAVPEGEQHEEVRVAWIFFTKAARYGA